LRRYCATAVVFFACVSAALGSIVIEEAFCRGGQVFARWSDTATPSCYRVYRSPNPIDSSNIATAELVAPRVRVGSAKDRIATYIASKKGMPDPNTGLRIHDLAPTLDPSDALWVHTVHREGAYYYAVTSVDSAGIEDTSVVAGENCVLDPISQSVGESIPVVEESGLVNSGGCDYPYKSYVLYKRDDESQSEGDPYKFIITWPANYNPSSRYQTVLSLHGAGGFGSPTTWPGTVGISPTECEPDLSTSYMYSWYYGWADSYPNVSCGVVRNYTERALLRVIGFAKEVAPIDENRVFLSGHSMGATGGLTFGLRHPEIFAAIDVTVPQVNPGHPSAGFRPQLESIWGTVGANLVTDEGMGVWDRLNMTAFALNHTEDLPFLKLCNARNDIYLPWPQTPDFYRSMNASAHGCIAAWGMGGHNTPKKDLPSEFLSFNPYGAIRRNVSYVAVSNSSANNNPGNGDPADGDSVGQMNAGYAWTILADTPSEWSASIRYTPGSQVRADISARRLQQMSFGPGESLCYVVKDGAGAVRASGRVDALREKFFIVPALPFDGESRTLSVYRDGDSLLEFKDAALGQEVDLKQLIVTAVFADRCFAEPEDRTMGVAVICSSGLAEGELIDVRGAKSGLDNAVTPAPGGITRRGNRAVPGPLALCQDRIGALRGLSSEALLVKTWGRVGAVRAEGFVLENAHGVPVFVHGSFGTTPPAGSCVAITGISAAITLDGASSPGLRVRRPSDLRVIQPR